MTSFEFDVLYLRINAIAMIILRLSNLHTHLSQKSHEYSTLIGFAYLTSPYTLYGYFETRSISHLCILSYYHYLMLLVLRSIILQNCTCCLSSQVHTCTTLTL